MYTQQRVRGSAIPLRRHQRQAIAYLVAFLDEYWLRWRDGRVRLRSQEQSELWKRYRLGGWRLTRAAEDADRLGLLRMDYDDAGRLRLTRLFDNTLDVLADLTGASREWLGVSNG
ncbi:MAG: hypothetical protein ACAI43_09330 [Phycisphaerae bacterium]